MIRTMTGAAVVAAWACGSAMGADVAGLKPIDPAAFQASIEGLAKDLMLPGALVLLSTPQGDIVFGYGTTELGTNSPPSAGTHFRAASNTKTMTAAAIVQMVQDGKLRFDDPISKYVDGVPDGDRITIRQLITMRSGLFSFTNAPELAKSLDDDPGKVWTAAEVLGMAFSRPAEFAPGAEYEYNNTNYYLLGLVAEKIDGKPLAAVFQDRLFRPIGLKNTFLPAAASNAIPEPLAHGYLYGSTSYALADAPYPADLVAAARAGTLEPNDDTWQNPSAYFAAGGVISTADDLAAWMNALVGGKVLDAEFQERWLAAPEGPVPGEPSMQKYGYGILTLSWAGNTIYYHEGEMPGYQSFMGHDPANDVTLVIWTNLTLDLKGVATANTLMVKVLDEIYAASPLDAAK
jgi:D-alanyl-D-alanine carboxypeptidase